MTARRKTLQNSNDDYSKILDTICRFAVHNVNVSFSCRKVGLLAPDTVIFEVKRFYFGGYLLRIGIFKSVHSFCSVQLKLILKKIFRHCCKNINLLSYFGST